MQIKKVIIPFEIKQKLIWKHNVQDYEVEEIVNNHPRIKFSLKEKCEAKTFTPPRGRRM